MKIGLDGNEANVKNRVGSGVYAYELLKQFSRDKNHNFTVYLKERPHADLPPETSNFKYLVFGPKKLWTRIALSAKLAFGPKLDVFFSMGHYGPFFSKVPYVVAIFDLSYLHFPELFRKDDLYQLTNWSKRSILKSKHIFAISQSTKLDIVKNYQVDPSKITVTYMGYDPSFKAQPEAKIESAKTKYKITGEYIIFVGTLQPRKNIERLIEAYSSIIHNSKFIIQLVIVGRKGWLYDSIFEKVKSLGLESKVIFTDFVPNSDLSALISGAKVYVLPSLWEGFGIPVVEAQACGVPVVVSNTSSLPEVVGESGILVDPLNTKSIADGIESLISSPKLASDLSKKGLENAKRFSWRKSASETLQILENL